MIPVSIVIITRNEAGMISRCISSAKLISDDIIIVDSGSTDQTLEIASICGCRVFERPWDGYGANKNKGIALAKYDWILSLDADEAPDEQLIKALYEINFDERSTVYDIRFRSYFGTKLIRFGSWGRDHHIRLFNRKMTKWSETMVHETLMIAQNTLVKKLKGHIHHYSVKNLAGYSQKCSHYAKLSAGRYLREGKKAGIIKRYISPLFGFVKNYLFLLGFLDGREGWQIAKATFKSTFRKYRLLSQLEVRQHKKEARSEAFAVEY